MILRPLFVAAIAAAAALPAAARADNLLGALSAHGGDTFLSLLGRTDLAGALAGAGPFTIFLPREDAFAELPGGTLDELESAENADRLTSLLSFHVVQGEVRMADLDHDQPLSTVDGHDLPVRTAGGPAEIGGAAIVEGDIAASNGVVHVIDAVLVPPEGL